MLAVVDLVLACLSILWVACQLWDRVVQRKAFFSGLVEKVWDWVEMPLRIRMNREWKRMEEREAARRQQPASGLGRPPAPSSEESRPSLASSLGRPGALS